MPHPHYFIGLNNMSEVYCCKDCERDEEECICEEKCTECHNEMSECECDYTCYECDQPLEECLCDNEEEE